MNVKILTDHCQCGIDPGVSDLAEDSVSGHTRLAFPVVKAFRPLPFGNSAFGMHRHTHTRARAHTHNENRENKNRARKAVKENSSGAAGQP